MPTLHHANIVLSQQDGREIVFNILKKDLNFIVHQNPDFLVLENKSFGIDEVRNLEKWVINKPFLSEIKVSLLIIDTITFEAQNALLKMLEEPPLGTYFFINLPSLGNILPTLLSRVRVLDLSGTNEKDFVGDLSAESAKKFFKAGLKQKFAIIKNLSKNEDKSGLKDLIRDLEIVARDEKADHGQLKNILVAKTLASTRGASPKILLEWLSCVL